ncbi:MAG: PTS sugar transporter subunit IIA [Spirochaetes bacterium]|nr:PTS sugar transporter subunit IIA [Spirochaetota bacterium]
MILKDDLLLGNIIINPVVKDRWELIRLVIDNGCRNNYIEPEVSENIVQSLYEREEVMSTGVGNFIAIPHCNVDFIDKVKIFLVISSEGINFDSIDGLPAKIIIILIVPVSKKQEHVRTLASIARVLIDDNFKNELLKKTTSEEVTAYFKENLED